MSNSPEHAAAERPSQASAISRMVVKTMNAYTGRGPTRVRSYVSADVVTVILRDNLTRAERSLADTGLGDDVVRMRRAYQQAMRADLCAGIAEITGCSVTAFLSDHQLEPDIACETFVLDSAPDLDTPSHAAV